MKVWPTRPSTRECSDLLCGGSASVIRREPKLREYADRRQSLWAMLAPYGVTFLGVVVVARRLVESNVATDVGVLLGIGLLLVGLVVVRQAVALREYRRLVQLQRSALVSSSSAHRLTDRTTP